MDHTSHTHTSADRAHCNVCVAQVRGVGGGGGGSGGGGQGSSIGAAASAWRSGRTDSGRTDGRAAADSQEER